MAEVVTQMTVADELRAVADCADQHPEIELTPLSIMARVDTREDLVTLTRALTRATGKVDKASMPPYFKVSAMFGTCVVWGAVNQELVCRKVVKGTREVPEQIIPARIEEDVEWECMPLLAVEDAA